MLYITDLSCIQVSCHPLTWLRKKETDPGFLAAASLARRDAERRAAHLLADSSNYRSQAQGAALEAHDQVFYITLAGQAHDGHGPEIAFRVCAEGAYRNAVSCRKN